MARWPQAEHWSRWPPRSAVRQRRMAISTFRCSQVNQAGGGSRNRSPAALMRSANSSSGRVILRAAAAVFRVRLGREQQRVEGAGGRLEMSLRKVQVAAGGLQVCVAEQEL